MRLVPSGPAVASCEPSGLKATLVSSIRSMEREQFLPSTCIPEFCRFICAGGRNGLTIRTERDTKHIANMSRQSKKFLARNSIPYLGGTVETSSRQPRTIRAEDHLPNDVSMTTKST